MFEFKNETIAGNDLEIYDGRKAPLSLHGLYKPETPGFFRRMPEAVAETVSPDVKHLSIHTSGARLRFRTDSDYIALGAMYPEEGVSAWSSALLSPNGCFRFDLYADQKLCFPLFPRAETIEHNEKETIYRIAEGRYEAAHTFSSQKMRDITINFPYGVCMTEVFVGVRKGCTVEAATPYSNTLPVVFYGSSITQGCFVSQPGNIYQNVLSRKMNLEYLNLGFAGSARAEDEIIDYICGLDMCAFVYDYDHNAPDPEYLAATHYKGLEKIRSAHPDIPIILLTRPNQCGGIEYVKEMYAVVEQSYRERLRQGDKNIYFISGQDIYYSHDSEMMTIDGVHPNDMGAFCMAEAIYKVLSTCLHLNES